MTMQIPPEVLDDFAEYVKNTRYANSMYQELKDHVGHFVAVADGKILKYSLDKDELTAEFGHLKGLFIDLITPENLIWIL